MKKTCIIYIQEIETMKIVYAFVLFSLTSLITTIEQQCEYPSSSSLDLKNWQLYDPCPVNSHCMANNYCACQVGFIGDCSTPAFHMENGIEISATVTALNYTLFEVQGDIDMLTLLSFSLCHGQSSSNSELIDVWGDNGTITVFDHDSAEPNGKSYSISQGCLTLNTPFMQFGQKTNGEVEGFILGLKLTDPGEVSIKLTVTIDLLDFWGLMGKLLLIIGSCFFLTLTLAIGYLIYKWRRRRQFYFQQNQPNNLDHFEKFMPKMKLKKLMMGTINEAQSCSVCLLEMGPECVVRKTICGHIFHQECLDEWCMTKMSCPICRTSLEMDDVERASELMNGSNRVLRQSLL